MASKHSRTVKGVPTSGVDNFKRISGIGPSVETRLHNAGIRTYAQLAAMSPEGIAALVTELAGLSAERIAKHDWIGQARLLAQETIPADTDNPLSHHPPASTHANDAHQEIISHESITIPLNRQHYATFTVELLLELDNAVRRTMITHIQSGVRDAWAGWDHKRLLTFFLEQGELSTPLDKMEERRAINNETVVAEECSAISRTPFNTIPNLSELTVRTATDTQPRSILRHGEAFSIRFTFDGEPKVLTEITPPTYNITVLARSLDNRSRYSIAETSGTLKATNPINIDGLQLDLTPGIYRLEAAMTLHMAAEEVAPANTHTAFLDGNLLHVY